MTQAAVSYQIKLLEDRLGVSLFRRLTRQLALTDAGQRIVAGRDRDVPAICAPRFPT